MGARADAREGAALTAAEQALIVVVVFADRKIGAPIACSYGEPSGRVPLRVPVTMAPADPPRTTITTPLPAAHEPACMAGGTAVM